MLNVVKALGMESPLNRLAVFVFATAEKDHDPIASFDSLDGLRRWSLYDEDARRVRLVRMHMLTNDSSERRGFHTVDGSTIQYDGQLMVVTTSNIDQMFRMYERAVRA